FYGQIQISGGVTTVVLSWQTNAGYCLVSGDSNQQGASSQGDYSRTIGLSKKLTSSFTLTAYGKDGVSKIQKTIGVRWMQGPSASTTSFQNPSAIDVSPDGNSVYVAANGALNVLSASTLLESAGPLTLPNQASVQNVIATPDGSKLLLAVFPFSGG